MPGSAKTNQPLLTLTGWVKGASPFPKKHHFDSCLQHSKKIRVLKVCGLYIGGMGVWIRQMWHFATGSILAKCDEDDEDDFMILLFLFSLSFWINALFHTTSTFDPLGSLSRTAKFIKNHKKNCSSSVVWVFIISVLFVLSLKRCYHNWTWLCLVLAK